MTPLILAMVPDDSGDRRVDERLPRSSGPGGSRRPDRQPGSPRGESVLPLVRIIVASVLIGLTCIIFLVGLYNPKLQVPPSLVGLATIAATWLFGSSILKTNHPRSRDREEDEG